MSSNLGSTLAKNAIFGVLSAPGRRMLVEGGQPLQLKRGERLFARGDPSDSAYAIITGEIEVTIEGMDGRAVWLARLGAGTVIGEMGVLDGAPRSADAKATRNCELWRIARKLVTDALLAEPGAALALLGEMARRLRDTDALVERTSSMELGKRLARLLLDESVRGRIIYSQGDIAHLIGATREAVNRKLMSWRKEKWVELNSTGLHVLDREALLALCRRKVSL